MRISPSLTAGGNLDVAVSTRAAIADYTAARGAFLDRLQLLAAGGAGELTAARAALLSNLDVAISTLSPLLPLVNGITVSQIVRPNLAAPKNVPTGAGAWAYAASYAEVAAAADLASHALSCIFITAAGQADNYQVKIATGTAGAEVDIWTIHVRQDSVAGYPQIIPLPHPRQIPANARVSANAASALGAASITIALGFLPRPMV